MLFSEAKFNRFFFFCSCHCICYPTFRWPFLKSFSA